MFTELIELYKTKRASKMLLTHPKLVEHLMATTQFLPADAGYTQRLWHHWNNIFSIPGCIVCGEPTAWVADDRAYRRFCSKDCNSAHRRSISKPKPPPVERVNLKQQILETGSFMSLADTIRETHLIKDTYKPAALPRANPKLYYSIVHHTSSEVPVSWQIVKRVKWLTDPVFKATQQARMARATPEGKLAHVKAQYTRTDTLCPMCKVAERPLGDSHGRLKKWCSSCTELFYINKEAKLRARALAKLHPTPRPPPKNKNTSELLNNPEWLYDQHHNKQLTKQAIAQMLGVDKETVTNRFKLYGIESIRHGNFLTQQRSIVAFLKECGVVNVVEDDRKLIKPKQLDIVLPDHRIAIEYCGLYWHSTSQPRITPTYHKAKYDACQKQGLQLITIFSDEWLLKRELCERKLKALLNLGQSSRVFARKCTVAAVSTAIKQKFFEENHIQGDGPSSANYGLFDSTGTLVACMGFIVSSNGQQVTLNRYATAVSVVGGFSKLLAHATQQNKMWRKIISFADLRWSVGKLYEKTGFTLEATIPPDYQYTKGDERHHKFNFRHKHLLRRLGSKYDPTLSETANTARAGWFKIYDCGKQRWVMNL